MIKLFLNKIGLEKEFVISKIIVNQSPFCKCSFGVAISQSLTTNALSKDIRIWKKSHRIRVFSKIFLNNSGKTCFAQPEDSMNTEVMLKIIRRPKPELFSDAGVESRGKLPQKAKPTEFFFLENLFSNFFPPIFRGKNRKIFVSTEATNAAYSRA